MNRMRTRRRTRTWLSGVVLLSIAQLGGGAASASAGPHTYAIVRWTTVCCVTGQATVMSISSNAVANDYAAGGFVAQVMWESTGDPAVGWFVEAGWTKGWQFTNAQKWYWASTRGTYEEHSFGTAGPANSTHKLEISYNPVNTYRFLLDGVLKGTASGQPPGTNHSDTGLESTSSSNNLNVTSSNNLQYRDGNNQWVNNWGPSNLSIVVNPPASGYWQFPGIKWVDSL